MERERVSIMERERVSSKLTILKCMAMLAVIFAISLPVSATVCRASANTYRVVVSSGYLALRTAKAYDSSNEIGELYSGDLVEVSDYSDSTYWYVYSSKLGKYGYVNRNYLVAESGGGDWTVSVDKGYLALRTAKAYDASNEIGELYSGDTVQVQDSSDSTYWYVYAPKLGKYGYVNKNYLISKSSSAGGWTVKVASGYLALRTAKAYDSSNEIGQLYTGDTVQVQDSSDSTYWYVYAPKLGKYGYVNKNYLVSNGGAAAPSGETWTVSVASGYLALRTAKAYDDSNEIGQLYSGDTVQVSDKSDPAYWYVYSPKYGKYGYVNKDYLVSGGGAAAPSVETWTVSVSKGYLALRTAKAYDDSNEIGQLYSGDTVQVYDKSDPDYWYVYSPKYGRYGYVNKNYLY